MKTIELAADKRTTESATGQALRLLRVGGRVPAVVYGGDKAPQALSVDGKAFLQIMKGHGTNVLVSLQAGGAAETVLVKDLQRDVLTHQVIHVDFLRVDMTKKITVDAPLRIKGEAPGVKLEGGILEHLLREIRVRCLPKDIPEAVDVDVNALQINQAIKVKDLALPAGVESATDGDHLVVHIVAAQELKEATPAAAAAPGAAEPEVITKGKKPEEGAEGAAAAPAAGGKAAAPAAAKGAAPAAKAAAPAKDAGKK